MRCYSRVRSQLAARSIPIATIALAAPASSAAPAFLDVRLANGQTEAVVAIGGSFNVTVSLSDDAPLSFNAALFRLVLTVEGCQVLDYGWRPPFLTGGPTDFSLEGLTLPATINDGTLEGPGYPIATADAEFGNFDFFETAHDGPLVDLILRTPPNATPGSVFFVVAYPDLFTDGFNTVPVDVGTIVAIEIANSGVFGDISGDNKVNSVDLAILLGNWGGSGTGDLDGDGVIGPFDIGILLGAWTV